MRRDMKKAIVWGVFTIVLVLAIIVGLSRVMRPASREASMALPAAGKIQDVAAQKAPGLEPVKVQASSGKSASQPDSGKLRENTQENSSEHQAFVDPRSLSEAEKEASRREIKRMHAALPGNMWLPPIPGQEPPSVSTQPLSEIIPLERKIKNDTASAEEKEKFYTYKMKEVRDKIDLLMYFQKRAAEIEAETGKKPYTDEELAQGKNAIQDLEWTLEALSAKLSEIDSSASAPQTDQESGEVK